MSLNQYVSFSDLVDTFLGGHIPQELAAMLRSNVRFWPDFSERVGQLLYQHEICKRGPDEFLHFLPDKMPPDEWFKKNALIWQQIAEED